MFSLSNPVTLAALAFAVVGIVWLFKEGLAGDDARGDTHGGSVVARPIMTPSERAFFGQLREAFPELSVCPQVSMGAILAASADSRSRATALRNSFDRKRIDYVLLRPDGSVAALVELDDASHKVETDRSRDAMTRAAGFATARYRGSPLTPADTLRANLTAQVPHLASAS